MNVGSHWDVADVRLCSVFVQKLRTLNLTWASVRPNFLNAEPDIGAAHQEFGSGSGQVRTRINPKFLAGLSRVLNHQL
jgi:hypothetical protein